LFADDTLLLFPINNSNDINKFICIVSKIFHWINNNHLILNFNKCCLINFFQRKNILKSLEHIIINNHSFNFSSNTKYLGIIFDENRSFSFQYKKILSCQRFYIKLFYFLKNILNTKCLNVIFQTYIMPFLEYCVIVYIHFNKTNFNLYVKRFNKLLNFTTLNFELHNAESRLLILSTNCVLNILNKNCPSYLTLPPPSHSFNTRHRNILPHVNKSIFFHSYKFWGPALISNDNNNYISNFPNLQ